jgi:hypothetical protein
VQIDGSVAALDVSIQAQILNLLADIREQTGVSYILISHDLAVVRQITDGEIVMHRGRVVERGRTAAILDDPRRSAGSLHPAAAGVGPAQGVEAVSPRLARRGRQNRRSRMTEIDLALVNGRIRTLDPDRPSATALAVADGELVAVGADAEIRSQCSSETEVIDLDGAAAVPGLIDSHMHPFMGAIGARGADLLDAHTLDDVLGALSAERANELCANHLRRLAAVGLTGTHATDGTLASLERLRALESRGHAHPAAVHDRARHPGGDVGGLRGGRGRARPSLACRGGEVLHRRRGRLRDGLVGRPRFRGRGTRGLLA